MRFRIDKVSEDYLSTIQKLESIGFVNSHVIDGGDFSNKIECLYPFDFYYKLEEYIVEFKELLE